MAVGTWFGCGGFGRSRLWPHWIRKPSQDDGLWIFVGDPPTWRTPQTSCQRGTGRDQYGVDAPLLEGSLPCALELIGFGELVKQLLPIEIGAAVDEDGCGRVELPDEITTPVVVVEDWARGWVELQKCDCAGGEALDLDLRLAVDYLGDVDSGE